MSYLRARRNMLLARALSFFADQVFIASERMSRPGHTNDFS